MKRRAQRRSNGEAGAELIEFALVFPLLLVVVLGIVDFAFLFQRYEVVTNASREGARVAVLPGYDATDVQVRVTDYVQAGGLPTNAGNPTIVVTPTTIPSGSGTWPATQVDVQFSHDYIFIDVITAWLGSGFSTVTLQAQTTMRNETNPGGGP